MFNSYEEYINLKKEIMEDIKNGYLNLNGETEIARDKKEIWEGYFPIVDYSFNNEILDNKTNNLIFEKIKVKDMLKEVIKYSSFFNLATIEEYAFVHERDESTIRQKCQRKGFKTAVKISNIWFIDIYEENVDLRIKSGKYLK